jgi:hypothetical protein
MNKYRSNAKKQTTITFVCFFAHIRTLNGCFFIGVKHE